VSLFKSRYQKSRRKIFDGDQHLQKKKRRAKNKI